jgi:signal transduction histidine kinase
LGELAAGTAHEIRNPLTSIRSTIQYLSNRIVDPEDRELALGLISEVDRINGIIQDMLSFSKPEDLKIEETDFKEIINKIIRLVENSAKSKGIEIVMNYMSEYETVNIDNNLMKQALINILMNAFQTIDTQEGRIQIEVRDIASENPQSDRDSMFLLEIRDNGKGISKNLLDKIFDPFYTTKEEGTGLGLSICYRILSLHGAAIQLQNSENHNALVTIFFPEESSC